MGPGASFSYARPAGTAQTYDLCLPAGSGHGGYSARLLVTAPGRAGLLSLLDGRGEVVDVPEEFTLLDTAAGGLPQGAVDQRYFQVLPDRGYELLHGSRPALRLGR